MIACLTVTKVFLVAFGGGFVAGFVHHRLRTWHWRRKVRSRSGL